MGCASCTARTLTATAIRSGGSGPSTPARAAGVGRSSTSSRLAPDDVVLRKLRYDAFYGTPLDHLLRFWGVDTLVICGTVANICVHYTAASAALRWYDVVIPRDAVSALDPFDLESSLAPDRIPLRRTDNHRGGADLRVARDGGHRPDPRVRQARVLSGTERLLEPARLERARRANAWRATSHG